MKIEMQIEDNQGKVIPQMRSNRASDQVVKEIYLYPSQESEDEMGDAVTGPMIDSMSFAMVAEQLDLGYERRPIE